MSMTTMMRRSQEIECHIVCFRIHMEYITIPPTLHICISFCLQMVRRATWAIEKKKWFLVSANVMRCRWPAFEMMEAKGKNCLPLLLRYEEYVVFVDECTQALCSRYYEVFTLSLVYSGWDWSISGWSVYSSKIYRP